MSGREVLIRAARSGARGQKEGETLAGESAQGNKHEDRSSVLQNGAEKKIVSTSR